MKNSESNNREGLERRTSNKLKQKSNKRKLTLREKRFVEEMANPDCKSVAEAARRAGYSEKSARFIGHQNYTKLYIREAIEERRRRALIHARVSPEEVLGNAVFNMRSSIGDVLDENGGFDIEKARRTGAIDVLKKLKETTRTMPNGDVIKTIEIEMESRAAVRKEIAEYLEKSKRGLGSGSGIFMTDEEKAAELYYRMIERHNWSKEKALEGAKLKYPHVDFSKLNLISE